MLRIAAVLLLVGCAKPEPTSEVTVAPLPSSTAASTTSAMATATATVARSARSTPAAKAPIIDTRCSPGQLNVPCVFQSNAKCFVRHSNCTGLPCTESAPAEVSCDVFAQAHDATACDVVRVCQGTSDEGCKVATGCHPQMATCIEQSCAPRILAATACSAVPASCIK